MNVHNITGNMDRFKNNIISVYKEQRKAWLERLLTRSKVTYLHL